MTLVRFECDSTTHKDVLVEVPDGMSRAWAERIEVVCPKCNGEMDYHIVGGEN